MASSFVAAGFLIPTVHLEVTHHRLIGYYGLSIIWYSILWYPTLWIIGWLGWSFPRYHTSFFWWRETWRVLWNIKRSRRRRRSRRSRLRIVCLLWIIDFSDGSKQWHFHIKYVRPYCNMIAPCSARTPKLTRSGIKQWWILLILGTNSDTQTSLAPKKQKTTRDSGIFPKTSSHEMETPERH